MADFLADLDNRTPEGYVPAYPTGPQVLEEGQACRLQADGDPDTVLDGIFRGWRTGPFNHHYAVIEPVW